MSMLLMDHPPAEAAEQPQFNPKALEKFFPPSTTWEEEIGGRNTEFVVTPFNDRLLVVITQVGRIGSWIEASVDGANIISEDWAPGSVSETTFETEVLFGPRRDKDFLKCYARRLVEIIYKKNPNFPSVLLGIAMKDESPEVFKRCMKSVEQRL